MNELYFSFQIFVAIILGGILGWQRVRLGKSAGPRTYALVAGGSALFTVLARNGFEAGNFSAANIAAQIVTGIGFLGIGLIFHRENHVDGLTTAAGLWVSAAIGMAVALNFFILATITTAFIFCVLMINDQKLHKIAENSR